MLLFIWVFSVFLGLTAIAIILGLVVLRVFHERRSAGDKARRQALMAALIRFSDDSDRAPLKAIIRETPYSLVTDAGFEFLAMLRGEERARIEAVFAETGLPEYIARRLRKGDEAQRIHAAEMLPAFPGPASVRTLEAALDDRSREVRLAAAISLTRLGAIPPLDRLLARIGARGQRSRRLIELFQTFPAEKAPELLALAGREDGNPFVRAAAIDALSFSSDYQLLPLFDRIATEGPPEVAAAAIRGLGRLGHPASGPTVLAATRSGDWEVRYEAAEAAGRLAAEEAINPLTALLGDAEWSVRYAAGKSLKELGQAGRDALLGLATGPTSTGQRTASMILEEGSRT